MDMQDAVCEAENAVVVVDVNALVGRVRESAIEFVRDSMAHHKCSRLEVEISFGLDGSGSAHAVGRTTPDNDKLGPRLYAEGSTLDAGGTLWFGLDVDPALDGLQSGLMMIGVIEGRDIDVRISDFFDMFEQDRLARAREFFKSFQKYSVARSEASQVISAAAISAAAAMAEAKAERQELEDEIVAALKADAVRIITKASARGLQQLCACECLVAEIELDHIDVGGVRSLYLVSTDVTWGNGHADFPDGADTSDANFAFYLPIGLHDVAGDGIQSVADWREWVVEFLAKAGATDVQVPTTEDDWENLEDAIFESKAARDAIRADLIEQVENGNIEVKVSEFREAREEELQSESY